MPISTNESVRNTESVSRKDRKQQKREEKKRIKRERIAQNVIKYNMMLEDGICVMDDDLYSRAIKFTDINYQIATDNEKEQILAQYSSLLQSLGNEIDVSLVINNRLIDKEEFENHILMNNMMDGLDTIRSEMNKHIQDNMESGRNLIVSDKLFTFTCKERNVEDARKTLNNLAKDFQNQLANLGCKTEILDGKQRLEIIHSITRPGRKFNFDYENLTVKQSTKDFVSPYAFRFHKDYFEMDDRYCCMLVLQNYPTWLQDKLIYELSTLQSNLVMSFHMQIKTKEEAISLINQTSQKVDMQIDAENQKNLDRANFSGKLPPNLKAQSESVDQWRAFIEDNDQRMFQCQFLVLVSGKSYDEMLNVKQDVERKAKQMSADFLTMNYEQEIGLNSSLALGLPKEGLGRNLLTDNCARIMPFTSQELLQEDKPIFYGINRTTNNMILCHRKNLANRNGFILGKSGMGKSFKVKQEFTWLFLNDKKSKIIIIDPQGEYKNVVENLNKYGREKECQILEVNNYTNLHFNPFDGDITQSDFLQRKAEIIMVMMAEMVGRGGLTGEQMSITDQVVNEIYRDYEYNLIHNPEQAIMPTLKTFYDYLGRVEGDTAKEMWRSLWTYVEGSHSLFAEQSNVDITARMVVFDISQLSETVKTLASKVILENIREQVLKNNQQGYETWVYVDEIYRVITDAYSENFLYEFWKWVRKFGGAITGISQDVTDMLTSQKTCAMLSNSEFYIILGQDPIDLMQLKTLLNLSDDQYNSVSNAQRGQGLMKYGTTIIPFEDPFPKDTICYEMWNSDSEKERQEKLKEMQRLQARAEMVQKEKEKQENFIRSRKVNSTFIEQVQAQTSYANVPPQQTVVRNDEIISETNKNDYNLEKSSVGANYMNQQDISSERYVDSMRPIDSTQTEFGTPISNKKEDSSSMQGFNPNDY